MATEGQIRWTIEQATNDYNSPFCGSRFVGATLEVGMSDWTHLADDAIEATFGPGARLHLLHPEQGRCVAYVEEYNGDGGRTVLAIAAGIHHGEACRTLIQMCYRDDHRPTTQEAARVLAVDDSRVRQLVQSGVLTPELAGNSGRPARFSPATLYEIVTQKQPQRPEAQK